jgi:O-acetyl-ADP-ribose deacetylase (regulator of RNase III)
VYRRGDVTVPRLLASAYHRSLEVAMANNLETIAFPAISTGIYGYPLEEAAPLALTTVIDFLGEQNRIKLARFVLFNAPALAVFKQTLEDLMRQRDDLSRA